MKNTLVVLSVAALLASGMAIAQTPQPSPSPKPATLNQRRENQQDRIANGVRSGQLTAGETRRLEGREANLNRNIRADRRANGGRLTRQERRNVNRRQNRVSRSIYRDKHNAAHQPR
ncbi:MAG TPA: hypothetical protein VMU71_05830 [Terracidiphilus sp.]|nr:hypothetical protein [Terracidiphilus sp.]